jgi:hypothetical protein
METSCTEEGTTPVVLSNVIVTALLTLFATQTLALDFTQATKDTTFVLSDANKKNINLAS